MSKRVIINGKAYPSLLRATRDKSINKSNIHYDIVYSRYCLGFRDYELFDNSIDDTININGKEYRCLLDLVNDSKVNKLRLSIEVVGKRHRLGIPLEGIFSNGYVLKDINKLIVINGKTYNSIAELSRDKSLNKNNIPYKILSRRICNGYGIEKALNTPITYTNTGIELDGITYKNITEIVKDSRLNIHNLTDSTVRSRVYRGMDIKVALSIPSSKGVF